MTPTSGPNTSPGNTRDIRAARTPLPPAMRSATAIVAKIVIQSPVLPTPAAHQKRANGPRVTREKVDFAPDGAVMAPI